MATQYLLIENSGLCPRDYITLIGFSKKRGSTDPNVGGWFGSGMKMAAVAAHALGIEVHVASSDRHGAYLAHYDIMVRELEDSAVRVLVIRYDDGSAHVTDLAVDAFPNWSKPIGDDTMRSFRVLREYLRNAKDEDPQMTVSVVDTVERAPDGKTRVYLTYTDEIAHMLKHRDRYFKYLGATPLKAAPGLGAIYRKSEDGVTRLFSQGTLAYCGRHESSYPSCLDASIESKDIMSEERVFSDTSAAHAELGAVLAQLDDAALAEQLIAHMLKEPNSVEAISLYYVSKEAPIASAETWRHAWARATKSADAVISGTPYADQHAELQGKIVVKIERKAVADFLKHCGVPDATSLLPGYEDGKDYVIVDPTPERQARLERMHALACKDWPDQADVPFRVMRPLGHAEEKYPHGLTVLENGKAKLFLIKETDLDWNRTTAETVTHEFRHARFPKARDGSLQLEAQYDIDYTTLWMKDHGVEDDDLDMVLAEFDEDAKTHPY